MGEHVARGVVARPHVAGPGAGAVRAVGVQVGVRDAVEIVAAEILRAPVAGAGMRVGPLRQVADGVRRRNSSEFVVVRGNRNR